MAAWPTSLPQIAIGDEFEESAPSILLRTEMDAGPPKVRPKYTAEIKHFRVSLILTTAQVATLETFFTSTIAYGADAFDWIHQRTKSSVSLRLMNRPAFRERGRGLWRTELQLELLP